MPRSRAVALVLVPLASAIGLAAQTPLQDAVSRCGVIGAPAQRLACYDSLAKVPARPSTIPAGVGAWQVSDEKNPLDDSRTVVLSLAATTQDAPLKIRSIPTNTPMITRLSSGHRLQMPTPSRAVMMPLRRT